jgi:hypothetical protein
VEPNPFNAEIYTPDYLEERFHKRKPVGEARQLANVTKDTAEDLVIDTARVATAGIKGKFAKHAFTRVQQYPHQQRIGNDGRPIPPPAQDTKADKKHFKGA